ncbi:hemolysin III family protein [Nocardioides sp. JQ2195]|uniref:PAQR family membrane homeostasis protein TrhA n=1 Tax=Nocardioides sp. JQ2195 TaxID=2592334 RepID=UPI00143E87CF|nr:hemolysin III family protein [Nocardioides sp. JQ2195]QIX27772.1 hemolysin III family protein [Nocardioides sp. JQ2195]
MNDMIRGRLDEAVDRAHGAVDRAQDKLAEVKPKLRGWLHAGTAPLALAAGIVLIALSPTEGTRIASTVFAVSAMILFTVSAIYHRGTWSPRTWAFLRRFDHANIFILIAGSYTPFAVLFLEGATRATLLAVVWSAAILGVLFRVFWTDAPRWLYTPMYIALGWSAVFFYPQFVAGADRFSASVSIAVLVLVATGGVLYTIGGVVYGFKRPDPAPTWFGFHEVFHSFTILAFITHYVGVSLATYSLR